MSYLAKGFIAMTGAGVGLALALFLVRRYELPPQGRVVNDVR